MTSAGAVDDKEMSRLLSLCGAKAPLPKEYKDKFSTKNASLKKPASCNSVLKERLCEKTGQATEPRKKQTMTHMKNRIYSSAYHAEKRVCIANKIPADKVAKRVRAAGQKAVEKWMASVKG